MTPPDTLHHDLLEASREIGGICESSQWATLELADLVAATGKRVDDLTVGELRKINSDHIEAVRARYRREKTAPASQEGDST